VHWDVHAVLEPFVGMHVAYCDAAAAPAVQCSAVLERREIHHNLCAHTRAGDTPATCVP
jgi:hypothetical protein